MQGQVKENLLDARKFKTTHYTYFALNLCAISQSTHPPFQLTDPNWFIYVYPKTCGLS